MVPSLLFVNLLRKYPMLNLAQKMPFNVRFGYWEDSVLHYIPDHDALLFPPNLCNCGLLKRGAISLFGFEIYAVYSYDAALQGLDGCSFGCRLLSTQYSGKLGSRQ